MDGAMFENMSLKIPPPAGCSQERHITINEIWTEERRRLKNRIDEIDHVLKLLAENPEFEKVYDFLRKNRFI